MISLHEISSEYLKAMDGLEVDESTGEILNFEAVDAIGGQFEIKAESVACYVKNLTAFAGALKVEEASLAERRKQAEKKAENMKAYLSSCMTTVGSDKVETSKVRISFRKSVAVQIADEGRLPKKFMVKTVTTKPDKAEIKKAIQEGKKVAGASLVENRNIQIK